MGVACSMLAAVGGEHGPLIEQGVLLRRQLTDRARSTA